MIKRIFLVAGLAILAVVVWWSLKPVEIVAVHDHNTLLVKNFPLLKSRQIAWWEANKEMIKEKYGIPVLDEKGFYTVYFQGFGEGYRADSGTDEDSDLLCFEDMPGPANCIEKDPLFSVSHSPNVDISYD